MCEVHAEVKIREWTEQREKERAEERREAEARAQRQERRRLRLGDVARAEREHQFRTEFLILAQIVTKADEDRERQQQMLGNEFGPWSRAGVNLSDEEFYDSVEGFIYIPV